MVLAPSSSAAPRSASACRSLAEIKSVTCVLRSSRKRSSQIRLVCSYCPCSETLALLALFHEIANNPVDVVAELVGEHLVLTQLATETAVQAQAAAQMHLETLDRIA